MFFEPPPPDAEAVRPELPELAPWSGPPALETGSVLTIEQTVARSANVVVHLPTIRAFHAGRMFDVEVVSRQGTLSDDDWWDLHASVFGGLHRSRPSTSLPAKLLRLGVRFADGVKATTIERHLCRTRDSGEPPAGPLLSWSPRGGGMRAGGLLHFNTFGLWLWPLPSAEPFEFAVEWPFGGIELSMIELDGAAIVAAAARSASYWPDDDQDPGQ